MMRGNRNPSMMAARQARSARLHEWRKHIKSCYPCTSADRTKDYIKCCDEGWRIAKALARATANLEGLEAIRDANRKASQESLF